MHASFPCTSTIPVVFVASKPNCGTYAVAPQLTDPAWAPTIAATLSARTPANTTGTDRKTRTRHMPSPHLSRACLTPRTSRLPSPQRESIGVLPHVPDRASPRFPRCWGSPPAYFRPQPAPSPLARTGGLGLLRGQRGRRPGRPSLRPFAGSLRRHLHRQAIAHARRTKEKGGTRGPSLQEFSYSGVNTPDSLGKNRW